MTGDQRVPVPDALRDLARSARRVTAEAVAKEVARPWRGGIVDLIHVGGFRAGVDAFAEMLEAWADDIEREGRPR